MELNSDEESSRADDWQLRILALVDGELTPTQAEHVRDQISQHPSAQNLLNELQELSPQNREFWKHHTAPKVSEDRWQSLFAEITKECTPHPEIMPKRRTPRKILAWISAGVAVCIPIATLIFRLAQEEMKLGNVPIVLHKAPDPLAEFSTLPVATADDAMIDNFQGDIAGMLVIYDPPLLGKIEFAQSGDIEMIAHEPTNSSALLDQTLPMIIAADMPGWNK